MDNVGALLSHCFGRKKVSSELQSSSLTDVMCMRFGDRLCSVCPAVGAFQSYLTAVMALQYSEQPDYSVLKAGLSAALQQLGGSLEQPLSF